MYEQVEKSKENKSRAAANFVVQKKNKITDSQFSHLKKHPVTSKFKMIQTKLGCIQRADDDDIWDAEGAGKAAETKAKEKVLFIMNGNTMPQHNLDENRLAFHPPRPGATWEYTRTVRFDIDGIIVRGHIHYTNTTDNVGPGNMWISGIDGFDFPTPNWIVDRFAQMPSNEERTAAVNYFNANIKKPWQKNYEVL